MAWKMARPGHRPCGPHPPCVSMSPIPWSLTGGVEGGRRSISPAVLHGKHFHKLLLEDGQKVGDAVVQAHVEDELQSGRRRGWGEGRALAGGLSCPSRVMGTPVASSTLGFRDALDVRTK